MFLSSVFYHIFFRSYCCCRRWNNYAFNRSMIKTHTYPLFTPKCIIGVWLVKCDICFTDYYLKIRVVESEDQPIPLWDVALRHQEITQCYLFMQPHNHVSARRTYFAEKSCLYWELTSLNNHTYDHTIICTLIHKHASSPYHT